MHNTLKQLAVLADKHVDSFGPELLNEAGRGTVCSLSHPVAECFSSSILLREGDWSE